MPGPNQTRAVSLTDKQFDLFVKIMEMTRSDNDHEAVAFLRKAQEMLGETSWRELLTALAIIKEGAKPREEAPRTEKRSEKFYAISYGPEKCMPLFEDLYKVKLRPKDLQWVDIFADYFEAHNCVTERQFVTLTNIHERYFPK